MSKFSLRKVLALGATVALGSTLIAGLPANAADPIQTAGFANLTYDGTGTKVVEGTDFELSLSGTVNTAYECYSYGTAPVTFKDDLSFDDCDDSGFADVDEVIEWRSSSTDVSVNGNAAGATVRANSITADTTATITAYLDVDATPGWSSGDVRGPEVTLTFANYVEADWVTTLVSYPYNSGYADLEATLTPAGTGWNKEEMEDDLFFVLYRSAQNIDYDSSVSDDLQGSWSGLVSATYTARAFIDLDNDNTTTYPDGGDDRALGALSAVTNAQYIYADPTLTGIRIDDQATANITTGDVVRSGTKEFTLTATALAGTSALKKAGQLVEFWVDPDVDMTFNGVVVKKDDGSVRISTTTNANGVASLAVKNDTAEDGNDFEVYAYIYYSSGYYEDDTDYVWEDAYIDGFFENHQAGSGYINSVKGQSYTLNWTVTDQFGQLWKESDSVVYLSAVGLSLGGPLAYIPVPVIGGKASYTVPETLNAGEVYSVGGVLMQRASGTVTSFEMVTIPPTEAIVYVVANNKVGKLDANVNYWDGSSDADVYYEDFETNNFRLNRNTLFEGTDTSDYDWVQISGVVTNSDGVVLPGAKVEVKAPGQFYTQARYMITGAPLLWLITDDYSDEDGIYSENSITVQADDLGYYEVYFASHKSGKNTVTASSGGVSASTTVEVATPDADEADDIKVSAPKSVKAGRSFTANVNVVDMWGNTVASDDYDSQQLSAFSNRGLLVVGNPVENEKATFQVKVLLQPLDRGPVLVDLAWRDGSNEGVAASTSFAVWSGPAATAKAGAKKGRVIVEAYRAVGKTVNVFVGKTKVASFVPNQANDRFVVKGIKSGSRKVSVKIASGYDYLWQRDGRISVK